MVFNDILSPVASKATEAIRLLEASETRCDAATREVAGLRQKLAAVETIDPKSVSSLLVRLERLGAINGSVKTATTQLLSKTPMECLLQLADLAVGQLETVTHKTATETGKLVDISVVKRNAGQTDNWFRSAGHR